MEKKDIWSLTYFKKFTYKSKECNSACSQQVHLFFDVSEPATECRCLISRAIVHTMGLFRIHGVMGLLCLPFVSPDCFIINIKIPSDAIIRLYGLAAPCETVTCNTCANSEHLD